MNRYERQQRVQKIGSLIGILAVTGAVIWIDIATGLWQDVVILSGVAAGLVTFLFTVLVLDRIIARETARRWAPVNRLAVSEFLHDVADDRSELTRGKFIPRALPDIPSNLIGKELDDRLHSLRDQVVIERAVLVDAVSRWAQFLASTGDNELILLHISTLAMQLEQIRDATLEIESAVSSGDQILVSETRNQLAEEINGCNEAFVNLVGELQIQLQELA